MFSANYKLYFLLILGIVLSLITGTGCTKKHHLYVLASGDDVAFIKPDYGSRILKIDGTPVEIIADGVWTFSGSERKYSSVSIQPGQHKVEVLIEDFDSAPVFSLEADFKKNKLYVVKFNVVDRIGYGHVWVVNVWMEDSETGKKIIKPIRRVLKQTRKQIEEINRYSQDRAF